MFAIKVRRYQYLQSKRSLMYYCFGSVVIWLLLLLKYHKEIGNSFVLFIGVLLTYLIKGLAVNLAIGIAFIIKYKQKNHMLREPELWYATSLTAILGLNYFGVVLDMNIKGKIIIDIFTGLYYAVMTGVVISKWKSWQRYFNKNFDEIDDWAQKLQNDLEAMVELEKTLVV